MHFSPRDINHMGYIRNIVGGGGAIAAEIPRATFLFHNVVYISRYHMGAELEGPHVCMYGRCRQLSVAGEHE